MSTFSFRTITATTLLATALFAPVTAGATQAAEPRSVSVTFSDLNLASEEGRAALNRRIERAAQEACSAANTQTSTRVKTQYRACLAEARTSVGKKVEAAIAAAGRPSSIAEAKN